MKFMSPWLRSDLRVGSWVTVVFKCGKQNLTEELINCPDLPLHFTACDLVVFGFHILFVMQMFCWFWRQPKVF